MTSQKKYGRKLILWSLFLICFFPYAPSFGQSLDFSNVDLLKIAEPSRSQGWINFRSNLTTAPKDIFNKHKSAFGLDPKADMQLIQTQTDELGFTHYRFQQYYQGLEVEGARFVIHAKNGRALKGNGPILAKLNLSTTPVITAAKSLSLAKQALPAQLYMWDDPKAEQLLKQLRDDPTATYFPEPELRIILDQTNGIDQSLHRLAYKVAIHSSQPYEASSIYVDARDGRILKKVPILLNCTPAAGCTLYNGDQVIFTEPDGANDFILYDDCRGDGVRTFQFGNNGDFHDADNNWEDTDQCGAVSAHWAAQKTYDFYSQTLNRNSYDDLGGRIWSFIGLEQDNAYWENENNIMVFGGGINHASDLMVSLDVVAHEFTHGVTRSTADLENLGESGALNESFSDIMGTALEFFVEGENADYTILEDTWVVDGYLRNMMDPKAKDEVFFNWVCEDGVLRLEQPDTYLGENWMDPLDPCNNGGVHINSGVQNFWLLTC